MWGRRGALGGIKPNVGIPNFGPFLDASQCLHKLLLVTIEKNFFSVENKISKNEKRSH